MNNEMLFHKLDFLHEMFERRRKRGCLKNISRGQGRILAILKWCDGISTKELSEILDIRVTSLNETLNRLEAEGFIEKVKSDVDKRVLVVCLTDKGHNFKPPKPQDTDIFDCLSDSEKTQFDEYLNRLTNEFNLKLIKEDPEKFNQMVNKRREIFKKYFNEDSKDMRWFRMIDDK